MAREGEARQEGSGISVRTLVIASIASAAAAYLTSLFWLKGSAIAAAVTPVIVTLVSEALHRPTERIARTLTSDRGAVLKEPGDPEPPPRREGVAPPPTVYGRKRRFPAQAVAITAGLAFLIGIAALTLPEIIAGQSLAKGDRGTTIFGGGARERNSDDRRQDAPADQQPEQQQQQPEPQQTQPQTQPSAEPQATQPAPPTTALSAPEQP